MSVFTCSRTVPAERHAAPRAKLFANAQPVQHRPVPRVVDPVQVIEQTAPAPDELQQPAARMMVLLVQFEMLGQIGDTVRQYRNLYFRRAAVAVMPPILLDDPCLLRLRQRHAPSSSY